MCESFYNLPSVSVELEVTIEVHWGPREHDSDKKPNIVDKMSVRKKEIFSIPSEATEITVIATVDTVCVVNLTTFRKQARLTQRLWNE